MWTQPSDYVLHILMKVPSSELEESLLVLPFSYVILLLRYLDGFIVERQVICGSGIVSNQHQNVERVVRSALFLLE